MNGEAQATPPDALIVFGPTASGKSALGLWLAERLAGTIINADSMQLYRELRIITARPTAAEEARVPHRLYGVRPAAEPASAGWWREAALAEMAAVRAAGRLPILLGGTGMYLAALTEGLSAIPPVPSAVRDAIAARARDQGAAALHAVLAARDPVMAARLRPGDGQRIIRALSVLEATGRSLADWQARAGAPAPWRFSAILLDPPREPLRAAIDARFRAQIAAGALDEVRAFAALGLDPGLPAMKAHGVPELIRHLKGEITLDDAVQQASANVRQYAKRQRSWMRHRPPAPLDRLLTIRSRIGSVTQFLETESGLILAFICECGLTAPA
ncbi:MAG: tRNA (adenosine(37)-N6)-dimethylallyltransferase MiaA [Alphaproteobacteria bacterium]|nr:tRNA (adenosine(37)-N6)-dimethylallyltransferase MiaA [Alphaproteobacteria bacterium]